MAIKYLSYKDLSPDRRVKAGLEAIQQCRRQLASPGLTSEQRHQIEGRIVELGQWISGTFEASIPGIPHYGPTPVKSQHHTVTVSEALAVSEKF